MSEERWVEHGHDVTSDIDSYHVLRHMHADGDQVHHHAWIEALWIGPTREIVFPDAD